MSADSSGLSSSSSYLYLLYFNCYYSLVFTRPFARVLSCSRCKGKHFPDVSQRFFPKPSGKIPTKDYTTKLIDNAKFSFDPRSEDAVYTMGNIPPSAISIAKWATYNSCSFFSWLFVPTYISLQKNISCEATSSKRFPPKIYLWFVLSWLSIVKARSHSVFATPKHLAIGNPKTSV